MTTARDPLRAASALCHSCVASAHTPGWRGQDLGWAWFGLWVWVGG
eukprot:CAMPEP_0119362196 /NCGR_PEP_ID=MMETSP1334-20130426/9326_1 /TAXON_ID=127549 /ORGANISM="Calcidiscus leptoporus, Strain RCC1130" /LENGTH=45 /DNA_ID= /DNA_START= /DNA_END= /DNA_ORIENTATION=